MEEKDTLDILLTQEINDSMDCLNAINILRKSKNLHEYKFCSYCYELATRHTINMANKIVPFSHDGFEDRCSLMKKKCGASFMSMSENVAYSRPDMSPVEAWKKSSGHLKNMLGDFNYCGIGKVQKDKEFWYTGIFLKIKE
jgi:uncharacterized protein YkwD